MRVLSELTKRAGRTHDSWGRVFSVLRAQIAPFIPGIRMVQFGTAVLILLVSSAGLTGCTSGSAQGDDSLAREGRAVFGGGGSSSGQGDLAEGSSRAEGGGWGVLLESHSGRGHRAIAEQRAADLRQLVGRADVRIRSTDDGSAVVVGSFNGPSDPAAEQALRAIKAIRINGVPAFQFAFLIPPAESETASRYPDYELERARELFGVNAEWTLRIEFYDDRDRALARRVAEDRVVELRQRGETAFYYHGPQTSLVTVGIFGESDFEPATGWMSPRLRSLRQRFPKTLLNGATYRLGGSATDVPSQLTRLPEL